MQVDQRRSRLMRLRGLNSVGNIGSIITTMATSSKSSSAGGASASASSSASSSPVSRPSLTFKLVRASLFLLGIYAAFLLRREPAALPTPLADFDPTLRGEGVRAPSSSGGAGAGAGGAERADNLFAAGAAGADAGAPAYAFGRWRRPVRDLAFAEDGLETVAGRWKQWTTLKRWAYLAVNEERFFVAVALVQFNYVSDVFLYIVDKEANDTEKWEYTARRPLGWGVDFAPSSIQGCSTWSASVFHKDGHHDIAVCFDEHELLYKVDINVVVTSASGETRPVVVTLRAALEDALVLLFPLDNSGRRPAYVHKSAGMRTVGQLHWTVGKEHEEHFLLGLSSLDWTKALARRETRWRWASFSGYARVTVERVTIVEQDGKRVEQGTEVLVRDGRTAVGINLSTDVYDYRGHSQENAIWINGTLFPLHGVAFDVPRLASHEPWTVTSLVPASEEVVRLFFRPHGVREDHTHLGVVVSDFVQPFGYVNGTIEVRPVGTDLLYRVNLDRLFGVVEDHLAVW